MGIFDWTRQMTRFEVRDRTTSITDSFLTQRSYEEAAPVEIPGLEYVRNPLRGTFRYDEDRASARSIWDLQAWNGRLYLGAGDFGINPGPVDVWYDDTGAARFVKEFSVAEEEVLRYRVFGSKLVIPGTDATESWLYGNFYRNDGSGWIKHRTIPDALHVFDLAAHGENLDFAGVTYKVSADAPSSGGGYLGSSADGGETWHVELHFGPVLPDDSMRATDPTDPGVWPFMTFFEHRGELYVPGWGSSRV